MSSRYNGYSIISYVLVACLSITVLTYIILKASVTSFTHDESFTYIHYVHQHFMDIISYKTPYTNNHILNTVFIKYCEELFGSSELVLRLPNIAACVLYIIYTIKLGRKLAIPLIVPCFILLIANSHLMDFFSLARGYGLSFAFMLMSIYHLANYFNSSSSKDLILFNVGAFFAVLSNFSLLNYYVSALVVYNLLAIYQTRLSRERKNPYHIYRSNRIHLLAFVVFVAVLYEPLRRISKQGMLDFGGKEGFMENTFGSLINGVFYETPLSMPLYTTIKILMLGVLIITGLLIAWQAYKKDKEFIRKHSILVISYLLLLGIIIMSYLQHLLLHNDFYTGRFALFVYPLFMLNFLFLVNYVYKRYSISSSVVLYTLSVLWMVNFTANMNLHFFRDWKYDSATKTVVKKISDIRSRQIRPTEKVNLGINWLFEPTVNFYRYTLDLNWLKKAHRQGLSAKDDYLYLFRSDTNAYLSDHKPILFSADDINTILVKNQDPEEH